jgi:hypothetical protein
MARVIKKTITRYRDKYDRVVSKGTPGARKVREKSAKWYGRVPGKRNPVPLCENRGAAEQQLFQLVRQAEMAKAGIRDDYAPHRQRP